MKVKGLIKKLNEYNQEADVEICVNGMPQEFEICYGGSEGCTKSSCDEVVFMIGTDCEEKDGATNE